jgi:hypothetical protein
MRRLGTLTGMLDVRALVFMLALLGLAAVVTAPLAGPLGVGPRSVDRQEPVLTPLTEEPNAPAAPEPQQSSDEALEMRPAPAAGSLAGPGKGVEVLPQIPVTTESGVLPSTGAPRVAPADADPISDEPAPVQPASRDALPATMAEQPNPPPRRQDNPDQSQR